MHPADEPDQAEAEPASPDPVGPVTRSILAGIALRAGSTLLKRSVDRGILGAAPEVLKSAAKAAGSKVAEKAAQGPKVKPKGRLGIGSRLLTAAATRIATRSVPGAIVVGGALLAKTLHERRKNRKG
jgi:hypothetical protein